MSKRAGLPWFEPYIGPFLARQDWAQLALGLVGAATVPAAVVDVEVLRAERPGLASVVVEASEKVLHLVLGWRGLEIAPGMLGARLGAVLGPGSDAEGEVLIYDALADEALVRELLVAATDGQEHARRCRLVRSLVSHAAVVYDERLFMKCYRVIEPGPRPEIETLARLAEVGFVHLLAPIGHWSRNGRDLGLVREFLPGAVEGKALAATSLRDLLARAGAANGSATFEDVGLAGGDLGAEMRRLGEVTAKMHLALAEAFGRSSSGGIRLHGDYHLRRVMRADGGWIVTGFGDDPLLSGQAGSPSTAPVAMASPLVDLADLCYSMHQVAEEAVRLRTPATRAHSVVLAEGWERRNRRQLLRGYLEVDGIGELVPGVLEKLDASLTQLVGDRS
ncbi:MAG: hypothetical protein ACRDZ5_02935 [Acidimicrobiales bacterium]